MRIADLKPWAAIIAMACLLAAKSAAQASGATPPRAIPAKAAAAPRPSIIMLPRPQPLLTPRHLAAWVGQLSSPQVAIRRQAKRHLIAAGAAAVAPLKTALAGWTTPQMRRDMRAVLSAIAQAQAIRGPLVTLKLTAAPLRIILQRLCRQAGLTAQFAGTQLYWAARRWNIHVQRQPFWKVIQRIAYLTGASPCGNDYYVPAGLLSFCRKGTLARRTPVYRNGALLLAVQGSSAGQTIRFSAPPARPGAGGFGVNLVGFWAPGDTAVEQAGPVRFTQALDNCGKSLLASTVSQQCYQSNSHDEFSFGPQLHWPSPQATKLALLAGEVTMALDTSPRIWHVSNLASGKAALNLHGLHIAIGKPTDVVADPLNPAIGRCHIRVSVWATVNARQSPMTAGILRALPLGQSFIFGPDIGGVLGFTGAGGRKLSCRVGQQFKGPNWSYIIHLRGGLPITAWVKLHTRIVHVRIPFVFHNVLLPKGCRGASKPAPVSKAVTHPRPGPASLIMPTHTRNHPGTPATADMIAQWIGQLNSANAQRQGAARRHLMRTGPAAIPPLRHAMRLAHHRSIRDRLASIVDGIDLASIRRGPLVTLQLQHPTVQTVVRRLCLQAGLIAHAGRLHPVALASCNVHRQPFWRVLQQLAHLTGIGPTGNRFNSYQPTFGFYSLLADGVPIAMHGAGAVVLRSMHRFDNHWLVNVDSGNARRGFNAHFFALWACTKNHLLEQIGPLYGTETITDAHGKVVLTAAIKTTQNCWPQTPEDGVFPLTVALHWPPAQAAALALRGRVRVYLASDIRTLHVNNLGFGHAAIQVQGMNLVFGTFKKIPGGWQIPLRISSTQNFSYHGKTTHWLALALIPIEHRFLRELFGGREVRLYTAHGHLLSIKAHAGGPVLSQGWGYYRYTMNVVGGKPARANIRFFTRTMLVKLPFNFRHLPVPR